MKQGYGVHALTYNYLGRAHQEIKAARKIARYSGVKCLEIDLPFLQTSATLKKHNPTILKGLKVPEGYIPARNIIFYAVATYYAEIYGTNYLIGGHLQTDCIGFPDATPQFFSKVEEIINDSRSSGQHRTATTRILLPFLQKTKGEVVQIAHRLHVPLEMTWSCYYDGAEHCEDCESCWERADAFKEAGLLDPHQHYFFS